MIKLINMLMKIESDYESYKNQGNDFLKHLKESDIDIETKWSFYSHFCKINEDFKIDGCIYHLNELEDNGIEYYDDFYKDRYSIIYFYDIVDRIEYVLKDDYECSRKERFKKVDLNKLKQEIIETELTGCVLDW